MNQNHFFVIVFESTHYALMAEKVFKKGDFKFDIIPTPREITASCGLSIRIDQGIVENAQNKIKDEEIAIKGIYEIKKEGSNKIVNKVKFDTGKDFFPR